ncbi:MAG: uracil-DNA glycosylase [Oscillospiraceae bacterium]|nr:uracil-DNA glycosylase [Oscillospiraceae bacterium]
MENNKNTVNCFKCKHLIITWDTKFPKACGLFKFKSAQMPSAVIFGNSGIPCEGFELKT